MRAFVLFLCLFAAARAQDEFTCTREPPETIRRTAIRGTVMSPCYNTSETYPKELTSGFKLIEIAYSGSNGVGYRLKIVDFQLFFRDRLYIGSVPESHPPITRAARNITLTSNTTVLDNFIYRQDVENGPITGVLEQGDFIFLDSQYDSVYMDLYSIDDSESGRGFLIEYEVDINLCGDATYCKNGGACTKTGFSEALCECTPMWEGPTCEKDVDECTDGKDNCHSQATCENTVPGFTCACKFGYTGNGVTCTDIDECISDADNDCDDTGTCVNVDGGYDCNCTVGYENGTGGACKNIDECARGTDTCADITAFCTDNVGSFDCACNNGFSGDGFTCTDIDECAVGTDNCDATNGGCANTVGSFTCSCNAGYTGNGVTCTNFDECTAGTDNCHPTRATCTDTVGSFTCACKSGYTGNGLTCDDIDECALGTDNCDDSKGSCSNIDGSFTCGCEVGYTGNGVTCEDLDECATGGDNCHSDATCTNTVGSWTCACKSGYTGNGVSCTDINECGLGTDNCDSTLATCANTGGSFVCNCNTGYTGTGVAGDCRDLNECVVGGHDCDTNADCADNVGSWDCSCKTGFTGNGRAGGCTDINECTLGTDNCDDDATCSNNAGSYSCGCDTGFTGSGTTCSDIDECAINTDNCDTNAACTNNDGSFNCACNAGWTGNGVACTDVDECTDGTDNCDTNAACTNNDGSFSCVCNTGWNGNGVTCTDIDECSVGTDNCHVNALCTNNDGSFSCACKGGYTGNGLACDNIDECTLKLDNCTTTETTCNDLDGSFECICKRPTYRGPPSDCSYYCDHNTTCRTDIDGFLAMPVYHDGTLRYTTFDETYWNFSKSDTKGIRLRLLAFDTEKVDDFLSIFPENEENMTLEVVAISGSLPRLYNEEDLIEEAGYIQRMNSMVTAYYNQTAQTLTFNSADIFLVFSSDRLNASTGFWIQYEYDKEDCPVIDTCKNGGTCEDGLFAYQCVGCTGYTGADCDLDIDECATTKPCDENADCNNTVGSYSCACKENYIGNGLDCKQHIVIDELVVTKTTTSFTITFTVTSAWDSTEFIVNYRVNVTLPDGTTDSYTITDKILTVAGLSANTGYTVTIEIFVTGERFGDSVVTNNIMSQTITTAETNAGTPTFPGTLNTGFRDRVTVAWTKPVEVGFGIVTHYEVCYGVNTDDCDIATLRELSCEQRAVCMILDNQFTAITLWVSPYSYLKMDFTVRAHSSVGPSNWTIPVSEFTGTVCPYWERFGDRTFCPHREGLLQSIGFPRTPTTSDNTVIEQYFSYNNTEFLGWRLTSLFFHVVEKESTLDYGYGTQDVTGHDTEKNLKVDSFTGELTAGILVEEVKNTTAPAEDFVWLTYLSDRTRKQTGFQVEVHQNGDDCYSDPCSHGGACSDGLYSYTCDCTGTDYTGDNCEIPHVKPVIICNPGKTGVDVTFGVQPLWDNDETVVGGYTLTLTDAGGAAVSTMAKVLGDTSALFSGLSAYTDYTAAISVISSSLRDSRYNTNRCTFKTLEDTPTDPQNIVATPTGEGFQLSWQPPLMPNGVVTYAVAYKSLDHATYGEPETSDTSLYQADRTFSITGLRFYRQYQINVTARTSAGSSTADPVVGRTLPGPPYAFAATSTSVTVITTTSARVEWAFAAGPYVGPTTVKIEAVSAIHTASFTSGEDVTSANVMGLQEGLTYNFTLTASTGTAPDQMIEIRNIDTSEIAPGLPASFTYDRDTRTLSWTPPAPLDQNGDITGYVLKTEDTINGFTSPMMFGADVLTYQLPEVPPYTVYTFTLQAINSAGQGAAFELDIRTAEAVPDPVTNLENSEVLAESFTLTWTAPALVGVLTYEVTVNGAAVTTGATRYTATGLSPYTLYEYKVVARTNAGGSTDVTGSVRTAEGAPPAVGGLTVEFELAAYTIVARWTTPSPANGIISQYTVTWWANGAVIGSETTDTTSYTISDITLSSTEYTVTVGATTGGGDGPLASVTLTTPALVPEMPRMLSVSDIQADQVLLTFEPPANTQIVVGEYTVAYSQDKADCVKYGDPDCHANILQTTDRTSYVLAGLHAYRQYLVAVRATSDQGIEGPSTANVTFRTAVGVPGDVTNLVVANTEDGLTVTFDAPEPFTGPTTYIIVVTLSTNVTYRQEITDSTELLSGISHTFTGVDGGLEYTIQVTATTTAGSAQTTGTPGITTPAAPVFTIARESNSSILIEITSSDSSLTYLITYVPASCQVNCTILSLNRTSSTSISVPNLLPYTQYNVTITATSSVGTGLPSTAANRTAAGVPSLRDEAFKLNITGSADNTVDRSRTLAVENLCAIKGDIFDETLSPILSITLVVVEQGAEGEAVVLTTFYKAVIDTDPTPPYAALSEACTTARRKRDSHGNEVIIGDANCDDAAENEMCNGPLKPDTAYIVQACGVNENEEYVCTAQSDPVRTEPAPASRGLTGGEIAAIVICSILFLILIILLIVFLVRRRQSRRGKHTVSRKGRDNQGFDSTKSAVTQQKYTVDPAAEPQTQYSTPQDPQA